MSGEANGLHVDLEAALDRHHIGEVGVPAGKELLAFANAVELAERDADDARAHLIRVIGEEAALEAAAIIAAFNGLVRVADGTGIELDDGVFAASAHEREALGINRFAGAANSAGVTLVPGAGRQGVASLFG